MATRGEIIPKILLIAKPIKRKIGEKIGLGSKLDFKAQIDDFRPKL